MEIILSFLVGLAAGFVGAFSSGGGLISISAMILAGFPPQIAIATTRLSALAGSFTSLYKFHKHGIVQWKKVLPFLASAILGGIIGSKLLLHIDEQALEKVLGIVLLIIAPVLAFKKDLGLTEIEKGRRHKFIGHIVVFIIMIYAAMFGGGGGTFIIYALVYFFGLSIIQANANGTAMAIFATSIAFFTYLSAGLVDFKIGIPLAMGSAIGAYIGAHAAIKKGNEKVKWVFLVIAVITGIKLLLF